MVRSAHDASVVLIMLGNSLHSRVRILAICCALVIPGLAGCFRFGRSSQELAYLGDEPLRYYREEASRLDEPAICTPTEVVTPLAPHRLRAPQKDEIYDMPLAEAIHTALANATIIRQDSQFLSRGGIVVAGATADSIFDPALQQSEYGFGNRGVEAALADFDTQFTTQMLWGRSEQVSNSLVLSGGLPPGTTLTEDTGDFTSRLEKRFGNGGTFGVQHDWDYSLSNRPGLLFGSSYRGFVQADYRHPLWAGGGTEFTRIAAPTSGDGQVIINRGVVIARINEDISLADFELNVRNLLRDVEQVYWDLALRYHVYDSEVSARNNALRTWQIVEARRSSKLSSAGEEAQARDAYYESKARSEDALADLYESETRLRRLLGMTVNDGAVIRPSSEPVTADVELDWCTSLAVALTRRVELRRQKWNIKSLELQLRAARNLNNPRLDFVSSYQRNAFGDRLFAGADDDGITTQGFRNAYETLSQGGQDTWTVGVEFSMPLGKRLAHARVRNTELLLAKARSALAASELEIGHELAIAFQRIDRSLVTARSNYSRYKAAREREAAFAEEYRAQRISVDELLRAQTSVAEAKSAYYQSIVEYNQAISELHFRTGTLLEENRIMLAEAPWEPAAYEFAVRRAEARSHATPADWLLHAEPEPFALPPMAGPPPGWVDERPDGLVEGSPIPAPAPAGPPSDPGPSLLPPGAEGEGEGGEAPIPAPLPYDDVPSDTEVPTGPPTSPEDLTDLFGNPIPMTGDAADVRPIPDPNPEPDVESGPRPIPEPATPEQPAPEPEELPPPLARAGFAPVGGTAAGWVRPLVHFVESQPTPMPPSQPVTPPTPPARLRVADSNARPIPVKDTMTEDVEEGGRMSLWDIVPEDAASAE